MIVSYTKPVHIQSIIFQFDWFRTDVDEAQLQADQEPAEFWNRFKNNEEILAITRIRYRVLQTPEGDVVVDAWDPQGHIKVNLGYLILSHLLNGFRPSFL